MIVRIIILILFVSNVCLSQNLTSQSCSTNLIKITLYINGEKEQIINAFSISMGDSLGQSFKPPIKGEFVDVSSISNVVDWYRVVMVYDKYEVSVYVPTNMFLSEGDTISNEEVLWEWYITKNKSNDIVPLKCLFLLSLIDSEIELSIPAQCNLLPNSCGN
ncbi:hypothetical protein [Plebeiibacterium sediminum]|uniref:Uncharacterized protein n=1 Tax=Plebeiibacterium sediminum TaxID=2992112 RepID=A0AAE3M725_9BACT|nr:hypothetical protein [Plebeiobacterium sediminum]MCW3788486.1 hypothetical protein [Plebeiobacterium sediminum]